MRGVRFVDVLEDTLRIAWEATPPDEPRVRPAPTRHVAYTPLYNLHTVTQDTGRDRVAPAYESNIWSMAYAAAGPGTGSTGGARAHSAPPIDPPVHTAASTLNRDSRAAQPPVGRPMRPARRLTPAQRLSVEAFNQLGAGLHADFAPTELRSAFRTLARRYHPDRHPGASDSDRERLAVRFAIVRRHYETLLTALEPIASRSI